MTDDELWENYEINDVNGNKKLITYMAGNKDTWFVNKINPMVYQNYPNHNIAIDWRNTNTLGIPPFKAIYLSQTPLVSLEESDCKIGPLSKANVKFSSVIYDLCQFMYRDYDNLRQKAANDALRGSSAWISNIVGNFFPSMDSGQYDFDMEYRLPGNDIVNSFKNIKFKRP